MGYSPWDQKESDMTERLIVHARTHTHTHTRLVMGDWPRCSLALLALSLALS